MGQPRYLVYPSPLGLILAPLPPEREIKLRVELSPAGVFGAADPSALVLPADFGPHKGQTVNPDFLFSKSAQSQPDSALVSLEREWKGLTLVRHGNILELRAKGRNPRMVLLELEPLLRHILENLTLRIGQPIRYRVLSATDDTGAEIVRAPVQARSVSFYDNDLMDRELVASLESLELRDETFDQAMFYFQSGCRFLDLWSDHVTRRVPFGDSESGFEETLWSCGFLQFWKAITAVLEEPVRKGPRTRIFHGRVRALNLSQEVRQLLPKLKNIRDDYDVSHRSHDRFSRVAPRRNYDVARFVASQVLLAYQKRLQSGKPSFGPSPTRVHAVRQRRRSPLETVAALPRQRIAHYTIGVKNLNWETGAREVSDADHETIAWRIPGRREGRDPS